MLKDFLSHHIDRAHAGELTCIENCHVVGLYSVMLNDAPGNRIRLFYADSNHVLWHNASDSDQKMSLGYHAHHSNVRLVHVHGSVENVTTKIVERKNGHLYKFEYSSKITKGEAWLNCLDGRYEDSLRTSAPLSHYGSVFMTAKQHHTVFVPKQRTSSWIVIEGKQDLDYEPVLYSNNGVWLKDDLYIDRGSDIAYEILVLAYYGNNHESY